MNEAGETRTRSLYLKYMRKTIGNQSTGEPMSGEHAIENSILRFDDTGLLHGGKDVYGDEQPAIEIPNGHTEWWEHGEIHREKGPAIITQYGDWEEWWNHGTLIEIRENGTTIYKEG
jgi:hypothetical protein